MDTALRTIRNDRETCVCGALRADIPNRILRLKQMHDAVTPAYFYCCPACQTLSAVNLYFNPDSYTSYPIEAYSIPLVKRLLNRARVEWIRDRLGPRLPFDAVVYDLGAGEGAFTASYSEYFPHARVVAVEHDVRMREHFVQEYARAEFVADFIEPFLVRAAEKPEADLIILCDVLEHVLEPEVLLERIAAALKPSGHAFITVPNSDSYGAAPQPIDAAEVDWGIADFTCQHLWIMKPRTLTDVVNARLSICEMSRSFETNFRRDSEYSTFLAQR